MQPKKLHPMKRHNRPRTPRAPRALRALRFNPEPWFTAIARSLPAINDPLLRMAIRHAEEEIRRFSDHYPSTFPLRRCPMDARRALMTFLLSLAKAGIAPPGCPCIPPGEVKLTFKTVLTYDFDHNTKQETKP